MNAPISMLLEEKGGTVHTISPEATVLDAVHAMNREGIGAILVVVGDRVVGIFTERDVLRRVVEQGLDPAAMRVQELMTDEVCTIAPTTTTEEAMAVINYRHCRHLPVVEEEGRLVGLISSGDLNRWAIRDQQFELEQLSSYIADSYPA
jgi:CBS domain-containing protein